MRFILLAILQLILCVSLAFADGNNKLKIEELEAKSEKLDKEIKSKDELMKTIFPLGMTAALTPVVLWLGGGKAFRNEARALKHFKKIKVGAFGVMAVGAGLLYWTSESIGDVRGLEAKKVEVTEEYLKTVLGEDYKKKIFVSSNEEDEKSEVFENAVK